MKKLRFQSNLTSITAKVDGSVRLGLNTPELSPEEKVEIMKLQNQNIDTYFIPIDEPNSEKIEIKGEVNQKTQSQRMRAIIYLLWKQEGSTSSFDDYYHLKMEKLIELLKSKLEN